MTTDTRRPVPRSMARPVARPVAPPAERALASMIMARRAREAALERVLLGGLVLFALTASGFAGYGIATGSHAYDVRAVLPEIAAPFAWKKTLAEGRIAITDVDPSTTGSLPEPAVPIRIGGLTPLERPAPPAASGYLLRRVANGIATLESRDGSRQVGIGSNLPGAGRVLSIRRTAAGWVVITTETIIGPQAL